MKWFKKPNVIQVLNQWEEKGYTCWRVPAADFDKTFAEATAAKIDGKTRASVVFAGQDIIIFREEPKK